MALKETKDASDARVELRWQPYGCGFLLFPGTAAGAKPEFMRMYVKPVEDENVAE
jgi:hypothetical protein